MAYRHFILTRDYTGSRMLYGTTGSWASHDLDLVNYAYGVAYDNTRKAIYTDVDSVITKYNGTSWIVVGDTGAAGYEWGMFAYGGTIYAIHWEGADIYSSTDGGANWTAAGSFLPSVVADDDYPMPDFVLATNGTLHAAWWVPGALGGGVYVGCELHYASTDDLGATWDNAETLWTGSLDEISNLFWPLIAVSGVNVFVIGVCKIPSSGNDYDSMVFASHDSGASWAQGSDLDPDVFSMPRAFCASDTLLHVFALEYFTQSYIREGTSDDIASGTPTFALANEIDNGDLGLAGTPTGVQVATEKIWPSEDNAGRNATFLWKAMVAGKEHAYWYYWKADGTAELLRDGTCNVSGVAGRAFLASGDVTRRNAGVWIM